MKLNVKERIVLLSILPKEGDFKTLKQLRLVREALAFNDVENHSLGFKTAPGGGVTWTEPGAVEGQFYTKEVEIPSSIREIIEKTLKDLDAKKKLTEDTFVVYERFIENPDQ